jgi:hypothetical protein
MASHVTLHIIGDMRRVVLKDVGNYIRANPLYLDLSFTAKTHIPQQTSHLCGVSFPLPLTYWAFDG